MEKFRGVDYFGIEEHLSDEQRMIRDSVRDWVELRFLPIVTEHHRNATFPVEIAAELGEMGVFGATLKGYGCLGLDHVAYGLIMQELERGDSGLRSFASVQSGLVMYPIYSYGSDAQKDRWLPPLQSGEAIGCFGLTEPDHGSDLVEKGTPGYSTLDIPGKFSMRASITSELAFQDCRIPLENKLPGVKGIKGPLSCLSQARYGIAWGAIGAAMGCYDWALQYAQQRIQFGKPIGSFQLVQQKLVWMINEITKAQLLCLQLGRLKDAGRVRPQQISLAKMNNVQMALDTARLARDILGAAGIVDEHPIMRHMMNLETVNTYEGTHDIHVLIVGRDVTGLDAFGI